MNWEGCKKGVMAYFNLLSQNLPGGTEKNPKNISQGNQALG